jgi:ABC-2 type transport system ATP-binding protein
MISVAGVSKRFGGTLAVDDVSFEVARGEILGLLGPNGAGKTTTMRILSCFLAADTGRASVAGYDVAAEPLEVRRRLGYLPENNPLYHEMTVAEHLALVAEVRGVPRADKKRLIGRAVEGCGLGPVRRRIVGQLSKGYRQRVGLAGALLHDPEVLILDEPTVGLDPTQIIEIRELIRGIGDQKTVLLSSHILPEVEATCQRVLIFNEGHLVGQGTPAELSAQARGSEFVDLAVRGPREQVAREIAAVPGVVECVDAGEEAGVPRFRVRCAVGADPREELAAAVARRGWGLRELHAERLSLEDVFVKLTGGEGK